MRLAANGAPQSVPGDVIDLSDRVVEATPARRAASRRRTVYANVVKRLIDIAFVLVLLPVWGVVYLIVAALILLLEGGPVHHRSVRVGRGGREIRVLKFRSMRLDADRALHALLEADPTLEDEFRQSVKLKEDPRVTGVGRVLRRTSLDELPQVLNVMKGDMSLIGPRPVLQSELDEFYGDGAAEVLRLRPGLSGLWQVSGRSLLPYDQRVALDMEYAQRCCFTTDIGILLRTLPCVVRGHGAF